MSTPGAPGWPRQESPIALEPVARPWGLTEMQIEDPDGIRIVLVDVPAGSLSPPRPATGVTAGTTNRLPHDRASPPKRGSPARPECGRSGHSPQAGRYINIQPVQPSVGP